MCSIRELREREKREQYLSRGELIFAIFRVCTYLFPEENGTPSMSVLSPSPLPPALLASDKIPSLHFVGSNFAEFAYCPSFPSSFPSSAPRPRRRPLHQPNECTTRRIIFARTIETSRKKFIAGTRKKECVNRDILECSSRYFPRKRSCNRP